jgi:hypothetical protein
MVTMSSHAATGSVMSLCIWEGSGWFDDFLGLEPRVAESLELQVFAA